MVVIEMNPTCDPGGAPLVNGRFMYDFQLLDRALSKVFHPNDPVVLDEEAFDNLIDPMLQKRTCKENVQAYLSSGSTSPRILAMLIYSAAGNQQLIDWVEEKGMPVRLLYSCMIFDGAAWVQLDAPIREALAERIVTGGEKWDFDPAEFLQGVARSNAFPGALDLLVKRLRAQGNVTQVYRHLPVETIALYLEIQPSLFQPEIDALSDDLRALINPDYYYEDLTKCLIRQNMERTEAIAKVLGSKL